MKCPTCGTSNRAGARFCEECGQVLATRPPVSSVKRHEAKGDKVQVSGRTQQTIRTACPSCGHVNRGGIHFCEECGQPLAAGPGESSQRRSVPARPQRITRIACPSCGYANRPGVEFCEECGAALAGNHYAARRQKESSHSTRIVIDILGKSLLRLITSTVGGYTVSKLGISLINLLLTLSR